MARARNIKPAFFKNEQLVELAMATRLLFIGLWCLADREGRLEDRPKRIKMEIFPGDDVNVETSLQELHAEGFIQRYSVGADQYIQVLNFAKHQNPHHREHPSIIPAPGAGPGLATASKASKPGAGPGSDGGGASGPPGASPADSPSLIPESGRKPNVGQPPDGALAGETTKAKSRREARAAGERAIAYLNAKAGTRFQPTEANLRFPIGRMLYDMASEQDLFAVVDLKLAEAKRGEFDRKYLRPATLWNAEKFSQYIGQVGVGSTAAAAAAPTTIMVCLQAADSTTSRCLTSLNVTGKVDPWDVVKRTCSHPGLRRELVAHKGYVLVEADRGKGIEILGKYSAIEIQQGLR